MKLIKLDATDSTNDFMKELLTNQYLENFTVVTAETQNKGKGQMGSVWVSESGKNLTMSILVIDLLSDINQIYNLNIAVAVAIVNALEQYNIPSLSIKWPNDIMSYDKKIGGILIENSIKNAGDIISIVGIGLNVNQQNFDGLPKASSISLIINRLFDKEELLFKIVENIQLNVSKLENNQSNGLWENYKKLLFKKDTPMAFEDSTKKRFMGIIKSVTYEGKLELLLEDDTIQFYGIKEIQMLY